MQKVGRTLLTFLGILVAWFMTAAILTLVPGITNSVLIPFPQQALAENLPEDVSIMEWGDTLAVLYSERPGYVPDLYKSGALLVLPSRKSSCIDLSE